MEGCASWGLGLVTDGAGNIHDDVDVVVLAVGFAVHGGEGTEE